MSRIIRSGLFVVLFSSVASSAAGPGVVPVPERGFWVRCINFAHRTAVIDFSDGSEARVSPGDEVLGWLVVDLRAVPQGPGGYALLVPPSGTVPLGLWSHLPNLTKSDPPWRMDWTTWVHHSNQPDAIRYRAMHLIVVVNKPNGEPDDVDLSVAR